MIAINGAPASQVRLIVPWCGVWHAEVTLAEPAPLDGSVSLAIGESTWIGTVVPEQSGMYASTTTVTVLGGAAGWRRTLGPRHEHNDAVITRAQLARNLALECGETLIVDSSIDLPVGVDWVRRAGLASTTLDQLFPDVPWYVGPDGITRIGQRTPRDVTNLVQIIDADAVERRAELGVDSVLDALPGCSFSDPRLIDGAPFLVHDLEFVVGAETTRAHVSAYEDRDGDVLALLRKLVERALPRRGFDSTYRYQVLATEADGRLELQRVRRIHGLPDMVAISVAPGLAGASSTLVPGAEVLVAFAEGDPAQPYVAHMPWTTDPLRVPVVTKIEATAKVVIPGETAFNPALAAGRFVRWNDWFVSPVGGTPFQLVPAQGTMANAGTTVLP